MVKLNLPSSILNMRIDLATVEFFIEEMEANTEELYEVKFAPLAGFSEGDTTYTISSGKWPHHVGVGKISSERAIMDITTVVNECLEHTGVEMNQSNSNIAKWKRFEKLVGHIQRAGPPKVKFPGLLSSMRARHAFAGIRYGQPRGPWLSRSCGDTE